MVTRVDRLVRGIGDLRDIILTIEARGAGTSAMGHI
jgi:hypothetical protein